MRFALHTFLAVLSVAFLTSCGSTTDLTDSTYTPENQSGEIAKILIVGVSDNLSVRNLFEKDMEKSIERYNVQAMRSLEAMPGDEAIDREAFEKYFAAQQIDAVLVTRLVDTEKVGLYAEGQDTKTPQAVAATWWDHYQNTYDRYAEAGSFEYANILRVETNIYDVETTQLIWQCHSKSFQKDNTEQILSDMTKMLGKAMKSDGVVK